MKIKCFLIILLSFFLFACSENESKTEVLKETPVVQEPSLLGKFSLTIQDDSLTENNDVVKEYIFINKDDEKWILTNNLNDEIIELLPLTDDELNQLKENLVGAENLECLKHPTALFCATNNNNAKTKEGDMIFKTGYFLIILADEDNRGLVELEKLAD